MIVCDTSIWIEYFRGHHPYYDQVQNLLGRRQILALECIFGELLQGVTGKAERQTVLKCWEGVHTIEQNGLWLEAGEYSAIHGLPSKGIGIVDAAIAVATLKLNARLWTLDKKLNGLLPRSHRYEN